MQRGEIWLADLEPVRGAEANKVRPVVVVGNDGATSAAVERGHGVVTVVPLTTHVSSVYSFQVLVPAGSSGLRRDSKAQAEQVRSIDVRRLREAVGRLPADLENRLDDALRVHLDLS